MRALRFQYCLTFAVMGSILPYLPIYLRQAGLTEVQVGLVMSMTGLAVLLTPALLTMLADAHLESRALIGAAFALSAAALCWLLGAGGFWMIFAANGLLALAVLPMTALQDGLFFTFQGRRVRDGEAAGAYHRTRVFGSLGFFVPTVLLVFLLWRGDSVWPALAVGAAIAAVGLLHAPLLPRIRGADEQTTGSLPTLAAARTMMRPPLLIFACSMWLAQLAAASFYAWYPVYLTEQLLIGPRWVGLIASLGVGIEIFFMLGFGFLCRRFGLRTLMLIGLASMVLRFALLWAVPTVAVGIGTQVLHGMMVLTLYVAPPVILNRHAGDDYRSSMQGFYLMAVTGTGGIVGNLAAGWIAERSLLGVFGCAALLCAVATALLAAGGIRGKERGDVRRQSSEIGRVTAPAMSPGRL